jgi:hypothetical protein
MEPFAWRAILQQPLDYLKAVLIDLAKYLDLPFESNRPYSGQSRKYLSFGWRDESVEKMVVKAMSKGYRGTTVRLCWQRQLAFYQNVFRANGVIVTLLLIFTIVGAFKGRGPIRLGVWLFGLSAFGLYLVPVLTLGYSYRYGIPAGTLLTVSGLLGAASIYRRGRGSLQTGLSASPKEGNQSACTTYRYQDRSPNLQFRLGSTRGLLHG